MKLITPKEVAKADLYAVEELGCDILDMIDSAADRLTDACVAFQRITVISGGGNNGADGLCAALKLLDYGVKVHVWCACAGGKDGLNANCRRYANLLEKRNVPVIALDLLGIDSSLAELLADNIANSDATLDCLLGTGFKADEPRNTDASLQELLKLINANSRFTVSADIASGVDGNSGAAIEGAIKADKTVTFAYAKPGNYIMPGKRLCGELLTEPVRVPEEAYDYACSSYIEVFTKEVHDLKRIRELLPKRDRFSHKGNFGRVLVIAGSEGMTGAALLASRACLKSGAGLCYVASPRGLLPIYEAAFPEAVKLPLGTTEDVFIKASFAEELVRLSAKMDAVLIGCGLGRRAETMSAVASFLENTECENIIVDADGLYALSLVSRETLLKKKLTVTPHEHELATMLGRSVEECGGRLAAAAVCSEILGDAVVVCKGNDTVTYKDRNVFTVNASGTDGMATAGSGDVLAGIIAAFLAAGLCPYDAARLGVFIHGVAGNAAAETLSDYCMTASDIIGNLSEAFKLLTDNRL